MPSGIILTSASKGATQEAVQEVLERNGYEVNQPEPPKEETQVLEEPKRDDFENDEEFDAAHGEWTEAKEAAAEQSEADAEAEEEKKAAEEEAGKPKLSRRQRAIQRATEQIQRENEDLKKRLEALERGEKPKVGEEAPKDPNPRPLRANFNSNEEYEDALLAWGTKKVLSERAMEDAASQQRAQLEQNWNDYRDRVENFRDAHEDWDDVVNQDLPMHVETQLAIMEQENGPDVIYYLGKHPRFAQELAEMSPLSAVMEVGRLSTRLKTGAPDTSEANGRDKQKPRSRVPAPVRPVNTATVNPTLTSREAAKSGNFQAFKSAQRARR